MGYRLRYLSREFELAEGHFLIGRSEECQLTLSDPLVSRVHARLRVLQDSVLIEDLGSRNGVTVNGEAIQRPHKVRHGDRVHIGEQEMMVLSKNDAQAKTIQRPAVAAEESFSVLSSVAEKALALGRADEAERLLENYLGGVLADAESGQTPDLETTARAGNYAIQLAALTQKPKWVHFIFRLHTALGRPCSAEIVDKLYELVRRISNVEMASLRTYLAALDREQERLSKAERFIFKRLQGLEALAALK